VFVGLPLSRFYWFRYISEVVTMNSVHHWAQRFIVTEDDLEYLNGILLEREIPLKTEELAAALIEQKLAQESASLEARYKNVRIYNPADRYEAEQKIMFSAQDYRVGTVIDVREGNNPSAYGDYKVVRIRFDDQELEQDYAAALTLPHKLNDAANGEMNGAPWHNAFTAEEILAQARDLIVGLTLDALQNSKDLVSVTGKWFPSSLMLEVNEGHLNLTEAVLFMMEGRPLTTSEILEQIGGIGSAAPVLQEFCLNHVLSNDARFDEVGPVDQVLWVLRVTEPAEASTPPPMLVYTPVDYDRGLLTPEMVRLEIEIDDEWSDIPDDHEGELVDSTEITLNYPHRRMGTLPLNARMRRVFPTARRTPRIYVRLVDGQDGEEYAGWVVRAQRYVFGLTPIFQKHKLPVGAQIMIRRSPDGAKIIVDYEAYKPRTEWIRIITPKDGQIGFQDQKRPIGAHYDEMMLLGADDLALVDALFNSNHRKSVAVLAKNTLAELSRAAPQNPIHGKTIYSAVNVLRRVPPGLLFATMINNPDFEYVGNNYWKLSGV